ncbi:hypothetical protein T439DRAFT_384742 [Meredithblackwellia eburnea MCA 4105]
MLPPEPLQLNSNGFIIQATHFPPSTPSSTAPAVLIAPATAVQAAFYAAFAAFLAARGCPVLTFDYRYSGKSYPPGSLPLGEKTEANVSAEELIVRRKAEDDAKLAQIKLAPECRIDREYRWDMETALRWVLGRYGSVRDVVVVGHSVGGHLLPLMPQDLLVKVSRSLWVGAMNPALVFAPDPAEQAKRMKTILDATDKLGYFPSKQLYGQDLPSGVGQQWFGWMKYDNYWAHDHAPTFQHFTTPVLTLAFTDDALTQGLVAKTDAIVLSLPASRTTRLNLDPKREGWKACGHVAAFAANHADEGCEGVWNLMGQWILDRRVAKKGEARHFGGGCLAPMAKL